MIIFVDDEQMVLEMMKIMLSRILSDIEIKTFDCPREAIDFFENNHPKINMVVSDLTMPNMNGTELLSHLKKINKTTKMGIMSALVQDDKITGPYDLSNIDFYIPKPSSSQEIAAILMREYPVKIV